MARITPSSGGIKSTTLKALEDDEPYHGVLKQPKEGWFSKGSAEFGGEDRLTVDWQLDSDIVDDSIRDWISLRLGKQQNGTVSKLRMLLNAFSDKPRDTEVKWFNSETLEWGYDDSDKPYDKIEEGREVTFRGVKGKKQDGTTDKFTIQKYAPVKAKPAGKKISKATDEEPPF